ncbi:MAG: radical SAM protein [Planctomycetota bacterium]|nr:radical SAM protein [Planctomycetota bacterium]
MSAESAPPLRPLGMTRAQFVDAARARGRSASVARDEYRALFRDGVVPAWCEVPDYPVTATLVEGATSKFVLRLTDAGMEGLETESVLIPMPRATGTTTTLCVSSQIGCAMGCRFCETAQMGLIKNLRADQIVHQWWSATHRVPREDAGSAVKNPEARSAVKNIVFMGMGEPTDNIDEVIQAIRVLVDHDGAGVPASNISISTVGNPDGIRKIGELVREEGFHRLNLALSLNAPNDRVRTEIMPVNRAWPMARLKDALLEFPRYSQAAFCVEYVLIPGVNDSDEHCDEVCAFLREIRCSLNVIPYNPRRNSPWPAPDELSVARFMARAVANGQFTKRRGTKGRNVMAACGQLGNEKIRARRYIAEDGSAKPVSLGIPAAKPASAAQTAQTEQRP